MNGMLWPWLLAVVLMLVVVLLYRMQRKTRSQRRIRRVMRKLGRGMMQDVMLPDGTGSMVHIDFVVLTAQGLVVLDVKDYTGMLFGGEKLDYWTQMIERKSYQFENPLFQNQNRIVAVKAAAGSVPVHGHVVFTNVGKFPKGLPENTYMLDSLLEATAYNDDAGIAPELEQAWASLQRVVAAAGG